MCLLPTFSTLLSSFLCKNNLEIFISALFLYLVSNILFFKHFSFDPLRINNRKATSIRDNEKRKEKQGTKYRRSILSSLWKFYFCFIKQHFFFSCKYIKKRVIKERKKIVEFPNSITFT